MDKKKLGALIAAVIAAATAFWITYEKEMEVPVEAPAPVEVAPVAPAVEEAVAPVEAK
jgi:multidrug resistance efflux pump